MQKEEEEEKKRTNHAYHACIFLVSISIDRFVNVSAMSSSTSFASLSIYISSFSAAGLPYFHTYVALDRVLDCDVDLA